MHEDNSYRISVVKPKGKSPLGRSRSRWNDNIKRILKKPDEKERTGSIRSRIEINGRLSQTR